MTFRAVVLTFSISLMSLVTGCAGAMSGAPGPDRWHRMTLADGVELHVSENAGPEAQHVAEMIQSEMRSRYIGARQ